MKVLFAAGWVVWSLLQTASAEGASLRADYFFEPGCRACERFERRILDPLQRAFNGRIEIVRHDLGTPGGIEELLAAEERTGYAGSGILALAVGSCSGFGFDAQWEDVRDAVEACLEHAEPVAQRGEAGMRERVESRYRLFTVYTVAVAGLLDGINPCAISAMVFFMSLLAASGVRGRDLLWLGFSFCLASFLTYLALGFGLFRALHLFSGFPRVRLALEWGMVAAVLCLAILSFRDAFRFRKSGRSSDVTLQLSTPMKNRIHRVMRRGLGTPRIFIAGLLIGTAVTVLESVCTGQLYVPTLMLILREARYSEWRAWMLLVLYNTLFIVPLAAVFVAVYFGLRMRTLTEWSRRNVVPSKVLTGLFFLLMAVLILMSGRIH